MGITIANVSVLKNGKAKALRILTLLKLCEALDCQSGDILEYRKCEQHEKDCCCSHCCNSYADIRSCCSLAPRAQSTKKYCSNT